MRVLLGAVIGAACLVAGCQTAAQREVEGKAFVRADGKRINGNPALEAQFKLDSEVCKPRAEAAALAGVQPINHGGGLAGGILTAVDRAETGQRIALLTVQSCMAERGYILMAKSEIDAMNAREAASRPAARR
jgi:hypothetical protein